MKPTLWISGCSITHGVGVAHNQRWGHLVGKHLGRPGRYLTSPGSSIEWAADQILRADIRHGDTLLWGLTSPSRFMYYNNDGELQHILGIYYKNHPKFDSIISIERLADDNLAFKAVNYVNQVRNFLQKIGCRLVIGYMLPGLDEHKKIMLDNLSGPDFFKAFDDPPTIKTRANFLKTLGPSPEMFIDVGTDGAHPGPKQHQIYAGKFLQHLGITGGLGNLG